MKMNAPWTLNYLTKCKFKYLVSLKLFLDYVGHF